MLQALNELTFICVAIYVAVGSLSIKDIEIEVAIIFVSIKKLYASFPFFNPVTPVSFVLVPIRRYHNTLPVRQILRKIALVKRSISVN